MPICIIPGCGCQVPSHQPMDERHWEMIPLPLRKTIVLLWHGGKPRDGYAEACANAVEQVVERVERMNRRSR